MNNNHPNHVVTIRRFTNRAAAVHKWRHFSVAMVTRRPLSAGAVTELSVDMAGPEICAPWRLTEDVCHYVVSGSSKEMRNMGVCLCSSIFLGRDRTIAD
jgi:hypothetical protein